MDAAQPAVGGLLRHELLALGGGDGRRTTDDGTIVLYQGCNSPGYLSASLLDSDGWTQLMLKATGRRRGLLSS